MEIPTQACLLLFPQLRNGKSLDVLTDNVNGFNMWYMFLMELHSVIKKSETMTSAGKLVKIIMTNEIRQIHKDKYCHFPFICESRLKCLIYTYRCGRIYICVYVWWCGGRDDHVGQECRKRHMAR